MYILHIKKKTFFSAVPAFTIFRSNTLNSICLRGILYYTQNLLMLCSCIPLNDVSMFCVQPVGLLAYIVYLLNTYFASHNAVFLFGNMHTLKRISTITDPPTNPTLPPPPSCPVTCTRYACNHWVYCVVQWRAMKRIVPCSLCILCDRHRIPDWPLSRHIYIFSFFFLFGRGSKPG